MYGLQGKRHIFEIICDIKKNITIERLCDSIRKASQLNKEKWYVDANEMRDQSAFGTQ